MRVGGTVAGMSTTSRARQPVARLHGPGEIAAVVPMLCGFVPAESLVVVCLHGKRSRVGLTMRIDLPPADVEPDLVAQVLGRLRVDGGRGVLVVVYTQDSDVEGELPRGALVEQLAAGCRRAGVTLSDALLVRAGRWWSYVCDDVSCCPADGTPLDTEATAAVGLVAAVQALDGQAVLPSRADLVASISPPTGPAAQTATSRLRATDQARARRVAVEGRVRVGQDALRLWRHTLDHAFEPPNELAPETAAILVVSLTDVLVRDEVISWALEDNAAVLGLLLSLARSCGPPHDSAVCTAVAWVAHLRGDGALANVALDRALACDPEYSMAQLGRQALDGQVPPTQMRSLMAESRRLQRQLHPWTACHEAG